MFDRVNDLLPSLAKLLLVILQDLHDSLATLRLHVESKGSLLLLF